MKDTLRVGMSNVLRVRVPERLTVPALMPEVASWQAMPPVLGTSALVALMEWAAFELLIPHLEPGEQTVGVHIDMSHKAATPAGMEVEIAATLVAREGRTYDFAITARDELDLIGEGKHRRAAIERSRFDQRLARKAAQARRSSP